MNYTQFLEACKSTKGLPPLNKLGSKKRAYAYWRLMGCPDEIELDIEWLREAKK